MSVIQDLTIPLYTYQLSPKEIYTLLTLREQKNQINNNSKNQKNQTTKNQINNLNELYIYFVNIFSLKENIGKSFRVGIKYRFNRGESLYGDTLVNFDETIRYSTAYNNNDEMKTPDHIVSTIINYNFFDNERSEFRSEFRREFNQNQNNNIILHSIVLTPPPPPSPFFNGRSNECYKFTLLPQGWILKSFDINGKEVNIKDVKIKKQFEHFLTLINFDKYLEKELDVVIKGDQFIIIGIKELK